MMSSPTGTNFLRHFIAGFRARWKHGLSGPARPLLLSLALIAGILFAYGRVVHYEFVHFDDNVIVSENDQVKKGITGEGVWWAFTTTHSGNWHPLTWISHQLAWQVFGNRPGMHHGVNVLFHLINSLLLFAVFRKMTGATYRSFFVAALFAFHPLHVESVAWVAERKDVLSAFFFLLTLAAYRSYAVRGGPARYGLVLLAYSCGLMSKPMLVTLPFVLLLVDYWPLERLTFSWDPAARRRIGWRILEKVPLFLFSAIVCVVTYKAQKHTGSMAPLPRIFLCANAVVSYMQYLVKLVVPADLCLLYPMPKLVPWKEIAASMAGLAFMTGAVFWKGPGHRFLLTGWLWYLGMLVPVIGIVQVGEQAMADRYTYLPLIGIFVMIAWGLYGATKGNRIAARAAIIAGCACCFALPLLARHQAAFWENETLLFSRSLAVTEHNALMLNNRGLVYGNQGKTAEAEECFKKAIREGPNFGPPYFNLGMLYFKSSRFNEAVVFLRKAVPLDSASAKTHGYLGRALEKTGEIAGAVSEMRKAVAIDSTWADPLNTLCWYLATNRSDSIRNPAEAVRLSARLCTMTGNADPCYLDTRAAALAAGGDFSGAVALEEKARAIVINDPELKKGIETRLDLFRAKKPYVE